MARARAPRPAVNPFAGVEAGYQWIESLLQIDRGPYEARRYRLARMRELLADFGDPHLAVPVVHVAGSKGKGSTAALVASALAADGLRCGLYTSPHVESYRERVRVLDGSLSDEAAVMLFGHIRHYVDRIARTRPASVLPTTFELLTLFGFLCFRETKCDCAVIEVGIGGRTDATNLVRPVAVAITPIELEHTDLLGKTLRAIAAEKAGTIKRGVPVFIARQHAETMQTLLRVAQLRRAPAHLVERDIESVAAMPTLHGTQVRLRLRDGMEVATTLRLLGRMHAENAALAALVVRAVRPDVQGATLATGLAEAWLPGRSELVPGTPAFLLDGAHTGVSVGLLCRTAGELCPQRLSRTVVFGSVVGKDHRTMLEHLVRTFARIVITKAGAFKPSDPQTLLRVCQQFGGDCRMVEDLPAAIREAAASREGIAPELVAVTGSFYLVGEARRHLRDERREGRTA